MDTETAKPEKEAATKTKKTTADANSPGSKEAAHRMANVKRKKKAHKRNIRSSNANG
jgi:hypothetical protein